MSEYYFINQRIVTLDDNIALGAIDSDHELEPINLLSGAKLNPEPTYINIQLSATSGDFYPDIISSVITLYSNKIKNCLDDCGIDNIDYYPVKILDPKTKSVNTDYWFANICGRINCLDIEKSDTEVDVYGDGVEFESFCIDESRAMGVEIFRLDECGDLVIINDRLYSALSEINLKGVIIDNTHDYDGAGMQFNHQPIVMRVRCLKSNGTKTYAKMLMRWLIVTTEHKLCRDKGETMYTFVDESQALFYSTVFSSSDREATHFIDVDFAPRFKQIGSQRIYSFSAKQTYLKNGYSIVPSRAINRKLIIKNWDDILRFMSTIKLNHTSASQLFKQLISYTQTNPLYKALKEFGRIIKSKFILTYYDDLVLRQ